jgi:hypothetical protein
MDSRVNTVKRFALPGLLFLLVLAASAATLFGVPEVAGAGPQVFFTTSLTADQPQSTTLNGLPVVEISYTNQLNTSITFVVYGAFHNSAGQVVYMTTAVLSLNESATENAVLVVFGLPTGQYQVTIFAVASGGAVISPQSTLSLVE